MTNGTDNNDGFGFDSFELKLGDELRGERATLGKSLLDIQRDLRIKAAYISAIENCDLLVFENTSFLAGYVRSYARYLGLDPEITYARFCTESNYQGSNSELGRHREGGSGRVAAISASTRSNEWSPGLGGIAVRNDTFANSVSALAPVMVIVALIAGLGFGAWTLIKDIQRVDIAPIEQSPTVLDTFESGQFAVSIETSTFDRGSELALDMSRLYASSGLDVPIVAPRDGPIAAIDPRNTGSMLVEQTQGVTDIQIAQAVTELVEIGAPVVSVAETIQTVSIFAQRPAWVRVSGPDGSILFEKILDVGEEYTLPAGVDLASLRAGNADWVYLLVDGQAYGPVSGTNGVASGISLAAVDIRDGMSALGTMTAEMRVATEEIRRAAALVTD